MRFSKFLKNSFKKVKIKLLLSIEYLVIIFFMLDLKNDAICTLAFNIALDSMVLFWAWNYNRFSTSNFIVKVSTYDNSWKCIARENILIASRTWNSFVVSSRACEAVPIDDNQTTDIQQSLPFTAWSIIEQVYSAKIWKEMQDAIILKLDKAWGIMSWNLKFAKSPNIASASTTDLTTLTWNSANITWTTTINSFGSWTAWEKYDLIFDWSLTLTNSWNLILPTWANITTAIWDSLTVVCYWLNYWKVINYQRYDWSPLVITPWPATRSTFIAWEAITACNAVYIQDWSYPDAEQHLNQSSNNADLNLTNWNAFWQTFTTWTNYDTYKLTWVAFYKWTRSYDPNVVSATAYLYSAPWWTLLATSNVTNMSTGNTWYTWTFPTQPNLTPNTSYHIYVIYSNSPSGIPWNCPMRYQNTNVYAWWNAYFNWVSQPGYDMAFIVNIIYNTWATWTLWKAWTTTAVKKKFIWFATNTVAKWWNVIVDTSWISNTQWWITPWKTYYLSTNLWIIDTVASDTVVWTSVSSTWVWIQKVI